MILPCSSLWAADPKTGGPLLVVWISRVHRTQAFQPESAFPEPVLDEPLFVGYGLEISRPESIRVLRCINCLGIYLFLSSSTELNNSRRRSPNLQRCIFSVPPCTTDINSETPHRDYCGFSVGWRAGCSRRVLIRSAACSVTVLAPG